MHNKCQKCLGKLATDIVGVLMLTRHKTDDKNAGQAREEQEWTMYSVYSEAIQRLLNGKTVGSSESWKMA